jgi:hypothetical protein
MAIEELQVEALAKGRKEMAVIRHLDDKKK